MDERPRSRRMNMAVGLLKVIVLLLCIPLRPAEARRLYRALQSGFYERTHDDEHPIGPLKMFVTGLRDITAVLSEVANKADLEGTVYTFLDVPMGLLVGWAMPTGICINLALLVGGADTGTATWAG